MKQKNISSTNISSIDNLRVVEMHYLHAISSYVWHFRFRGLARNLVISPSITSS